MVKKLFSLLEKNGIAVYLPAKMPGRCTEPYATVNEDKTELAKTGSGAYTYFTVSVMSPVESYASLDELQKKVTAALRGSCFKFLGSETEETGGDAVCYKRTLTYRVLKRICNN